MFHGRLPVFVILYRWNVNIYIFIIIIIIIIIVIAISCSSCGSISDSRKYSFTVQY
jgi:hypothetical protein